MSHGAPGTPRVPRLDLYLAAAMADRDEPRARLLSLGVDLDEAAKVRRALDGAFAGAEEGARTRVATTHFGRPPFRRADRMGWELALWPEHRYELPLRDGGPLAGEIVRRDDVGPPVLHERPASLAAAQAVLRPWHHTSRDMLRALGDAERSRVAPPHEQHVWRLADGSELALDFTHGLLQQLRAAEPEPEPRRAWWQFWRR